MTRVAIAGAGPAGLAAAYRLAQRGEFEVFLIEREPVVGGLSAGFRNGDYTLDFGPHRFHPAADPEVIHDLKSLLGPDLLVRPRRGLVRIGGR